MLDGISKLLVLIVILNNINFSIDSNIDVHALLTSYNYMILKNLKSIEYRSKL